MNRLFVAAAAGLLPLSLGAQADPPPGATARAAPPPATKLEAFEPKAGSIVLFGYDELGRIGTVSVDVREMREARGTAVRGVVVEVRQSEYRRETAFVDADEIPELIKGIDALLAVTENPTTFQNFEVRYKTKGALELTAFNTAPGKISFSVKAGRLTQAAAYNFTTSDMTKLRELFTRAQAKLTQFSNSGDS